jgi:hypothetical protein
MQGGGLGCAAVSAVSLAFDMIAPSAAAGVASSGCRNAAASIYIIIGRLCSTGRNTGSIHTTCGRVSRAFYLNYHVVKKCQ